MSNYLDDNNQREIFVDTIQEKLIGPGADVFGIVKENELISINPVKLYYSGILFSPAYSKNESDNDLKDEVEEIAIDNDDGNALLDSNPQPDANNFIEDNKDDSDTDNLRFQSFFLNKFGLTFAVQVTTVNVDIILNFATYSLTEDRQIKIKPNDWSVLTGVIDNLNSNVEINNDFGNNFFALNNFNYDAQTEILDFTYRPPANTKLSDKKYAQILRGLFGDSKILREKFIKHLCGKNVFKRTPATWEYTFNLNRVTGEIKIPQTSLTLFSKVIVKDDKKIIKFLIQNTSDANIKSYENCYFQIHLKVKTSSLVDYKKQFNNIIDEDYAIVDYQYQDIKSFGKGVGCAVKWEANESIETTFLPEEEIKNFSNLPNNALVVANLTEIFSLKNLSIWTTLNDGDIINKLKLFAETYKNWNSQQKQLSDGDIIGQNITDKQTYAVNRILENIDYLSKNPDIFQSFKLANTAMMIQMIIAKDDKFKKNREYTDITPNQQDLFNDISFFQNYNNSPTYRPFQLAFLLMNIEPTFNKNSKDRNEIVDLIWFPTGGGKTEAYLALTALTIIERRRHNGKVNTDGVSVLMRYTLRLLTAQQFERATYLICALEFMRNKLKNYNLGESKITIGMWVGSSTTPNKLVDLNEYRWRRIFEADNIVSAKTANGFPISNCSWCGCNLITEVNGNFRLGFEKEIHGQNIKGLNIKCVNQACHFSGDNLPINFIDEELYNKPPTLLFATVDKMVQLSHKMEAGSFFNDALPLDLIIQDELHLLTGPLGSLTALYELVIEQLCDRDSRKPKIVASTATTRNTNSLIKAMYGRNLNVFPAQGVRFDDNFFSFLDPKARRKHIGVMPTGKTAGLTEIKIVEALYEAKTKLLKLFLLEQGIDLNDINALLTELNSDRFKNKIDPYWTFVFYYNNLRDLGRSKSRVSIDFTQQIEGMFVKQGFQNIFNFIYKNMFSRTVEFTGRQESEKIKSLLSKTESTIEFVTFQHNNKTFIKEQDVSIDLALASNMFSVGIDVNRLNLMLMIGQPGSVSEYIQASSRVARKDKGLVINLLNPMRTRELSIFEDFFAFHASYYKNVEPLSITPFTEMALDKLLSAVLVAYVKHKHKIQRVEGFTQELNDELLNKIMGANRGLNAEQELYFRNQLNTLSAIWIQEAQYGVKFVTKNPFGNDRYLFDLMNSLRDLDYDVYMENNSL